jgi:hypothetical protein
LSLLSPVPNLIHSINLTVDNFKEKKEKRKRSQITTNPRIWKNAVLSHNTDADDRDYGGDATEEAEVAAKC